jgi:hypothetical protein
VSPIVSQENLSTVVCDWDRSMVQAGKNPKVSKETYATLRELVEVMRMRTRMTNGDDENETQIPEHFGPTGGG